MEILDLSRSTPVLAALILLAVASPSLAADLPTLPPLTVDPNLQPPDWKGFYVGSGVSFAAAKGSKGMVGGDVFAGYDHVFQNNLVLGVQFDTGYAPFMTSNGRLKGFDFAETSVKLGYEMGRLTPFVSVGVGGAKATSFGSGLPDANNSINGLFYGPGAVQAVGSVGAGFDYAVTNNVHVGVAAYLNSAGGGLPH